ncbi:hypothetical protein XFF6166_290001 [Xanthomonas citri pv. fuscans]|nr:hypothetical protein XFF6166_290001 [Xanthomonas citri pv. fuscans]SOO00511.1 hypothetical protein XFF6960_330001 [Xanthomonas citri pv. fuscans]SOO04136.1 hypothetical protein XFF7767_230025 [Xanthomonas citri pv. fuscans]SOO10141.1 hypothetical protein XFF6970_50022 [Xanthomonas citri pv. fuscans]SOO42675.1 hypothetical protein XFF1815_240025 [Xanthomonas citri pv. fuscans]
MGGGITITPAGCLVVLVRLVLNLPSCRRERTRRKGGGRYAVIKTGGQKREPAGLAASAHRPP